MSEAFSIVNSTPIHAENILQSGHTHLAGNSNCLNKPKQSGAVKGRAMPTSYGRGRS